jgi:hypothetical protein
MLPPASGYTVVGGSGSLPKLVPINLPFNYHRRNSWIMNSLQPIQERRTCSVVTVNTTNCTVEDFRLLVSPAESQLTFRRNLLPPFSRSNDKRSLKPV